MPSNRIRLASAAVGTSALLAMGGLTVAFSTTSVAQPPGPVDSGSTTTTQASEEAPPEEAPAVTPSSAPPAVGKN